MRNRTLPVLLAACLTLVLAAVATPGAADDEAQVAAAAPLAAPAPADLEAPAPAPQPALECPAASTQQPLFLAPPPPPTCEECTAACEADYIQCDSHCHGRTCVSNCIGRLDLCLADCPC